MSGPWNLAAPPALSGGIKSPDDTSVEERACIHPLMDAHLRIFSAGNGEMELRKRAETSAVLYLAGVTAA